MSSNPSQSRPLGFWLLAGLCGVLAFVSLIFLLLFFTGGESEITRAVTDGKRLLIEAKSGKVTGGIRSSDSATTTPPVQMGESVQRDVVPTTAPAATAPPAYTGFDVGGEEEPLNPQASGGEAEPAISPMAAGAGLVGSEDETLDTIPVEPRTPISLADTQGSPLLEVTAAGVLPRKNGGDTPFDAFKRSFEMPKPPKPLIGIVLMDIGSRKSISEAAMNLPEDVSFALNPYAPHIAPWTQSARNRGHETWLIAPAQSEEFPANDPGPLGILVDLKPEELDVRLIALLSRPAGYAGIVLPAGEVISDEAGVMNWLGKQLSARGIGMLVSDPPKSKAMVDWLNAQPRMGVSQLLINRPLEKASFVAQLESLKTIAKQNGRVVAVIYAYPNMIGPLGEWLAALPESQFELAPVSALID